MMAGGKLLGVLNLESINKESFSDRQIRAIEYAARIAALAFRLFQEVASNRQLRALMKNLQECFVEAAKTADAAQSAVYELAKLASRCLGADRCHIWDYDSARTVNFYGGTTYAGCAAREELPRQNGWSNHICSTKQFVWVTNIQSQYQYDVFYWNPRSCSWEKEVPLGNRVPERLHDPWVCRRFSSELGIPILVKNRCIGIAWVKFDRPGVLPPSPDQMSLAVGFAGGAGLIMEWVRLQAVEGLDMHEELQKHINYQLLELGTKLWVSHEASQPQLI